MVDSVNPTPGQPENSKPYKAQYHWNDKSMKFAHHILDNSKFGVASDDDCKKFLDQLAKGMGDWIAQNQKQYEEWREDAIEQGILPNPNDAG